MKLIRLLTLYFIIGIIRSYQIMISPFMPCCCRYTPSCSSYAIEAINKYGILQGGYMSLLRILKCNPFNKNSGHDPV